MPSFKAAYLIHGDDHGRIGERRARLRAMAEAESGQNGVELFEADACTADAVAAALSAMTFAIGRRYVIADGVERWKEADVAPVAAAVKSMDPETLTVAFFAREEGRAKAPAALHKAVEAAGGVIAAEMALKARALPRWLAGQAAELGVELDDQARPRARRPGRRAPPAAAARDREARARARRRRARSASRRSRRPAPAPPSAAPGRWPTRSSPGDEKTATRALLELRQQGERIPSLLYQMVRRVRDALAIAEALAAGQPASQVKRGLRMPSFAADRLIADVSSRDPEAYRRALELLADLEVESRGGVGMLSGALSEDTAAVRAVLAASR